jgi:hypothetical protein
LQIADCKLQIENRGISSGGTALVAFALAAVLPFGEQVVHNDDDREQHYTTKEEENAWNDRAGAQKLPAGGTGVATRMAPLEVLCAQS